MGRISYRAPGRPYRFRASLFLSLPPPCISDVKQRDMNVYDAVRRVRSIIYWLHFARRHAPRLKTVQTVCLMRRILLARKRRPSRYISPFLPRSSTLLLLLPRRPCCGYRALCLAIERAREMCRKSAKRNASREGDDRHRSFSIRANGDRFITTRDAARFLQAKDTPPRSSRGRSREFGGSRKVLT